MDLKVFSDANWVGSMDDSEGTGGEAFFLGKRLVSWTRKKQNCTSQSTVEAEYVVVAVNCSNIVWIKQLLEGIQVEIKDPLVIYCDNTNAINKSRNPLMHIKTKQIAINIIS